MHITLHKKNVDFDLITKRRVEFNVSLGRRHSVLLYLTRTVVATLLSGVVCERLSMDVIVTSAFCAFHIEVMADENEQCNDAKNSIARWTVKMANATAKDI